MKLTTMIHCSLLLISASSFTLPEDIFVLSAGQAPKNGTRDTVQEAIQTLHEDQAADHITTLKSFRNKPQEIDNNDTMMNWLSRQTRFPEDQTLEDIIDIYSDIFDQSLVYSDINELLIPYGSMIFSKDIYGSESNTSPYDPVAINSNFNLNQIVKFRRMYSENLVTIHVYFYAINQVNVDVVGNSIKEHLFPNAPFTHMYSDLLWFDYADEPAMYGMYTVTYQDAIDSAIQDFGNPNNWRKTYDEYSFAVDDMTVFIYGLNAVCSNPMVYLEYLYGIKMEDEPSFGAIACSYCKENGREESQD